MENQKYSKLLINEKKHNLISLGFNVLFFITSLIILSWFVLSSFGWFTFLLPIFFTIYSSFKIWKYIQLNSNLQKLAKNAELSEMNFHIYFQWQRKKIGNNYFSIFVSILLLVYFAIYILLAFTTNWVTANKDFIVSFSIVWSLVLLGQLLFWNFDNVWLTDLLKKYEYFVSYRKGLNLELETHQDQAKKDYLYIISLIVGVITIVWGIYLIFKKISN